MCTLVVHKYYRNHSLKDLTKMIDFSILTVDLISPQIGTYQMAVMAKALNKPFYVVAESFKFVRMFPLNQDDLPNRVNVSHYGNC